MNSTDGMSLVSTDQPAAGCFKIESHPATCFGSDFDAVAPKRTNSIASSSWCRKSNCFSHIVARLMNKSRLTIKLTVWMRHWVSLVRRVLLYDVVTVHVTLTSGGWHPLTVPRPSNAVLNRTVWRYASASVGLDFSVFLSIARLPPLNIGMAWHLLVLIDCYIFCAHCKCLLICTLDILLLTYLLSLLCM